MMGWRPMRASMKSALIRVAMLVWTVALVPTVALRAAAREERSAAGLPELVRTRQQA